VLHRYQLRATAIPDEKPDMKVVLQLRWLEEESEVSNFG